MPDVTRATRRSLAVSGLWSGLGFIGAGVLAAGLLMLVNGGIGAVIALVMIVAGGAVATAGWRGAWKALAALERRPAEAAGASVAGD